MRIGLILCVLAVTGYTFFSATTWAEASDTSAELGALVQDAQADAATIAQLEDATTEQAALIAATTVAKQDAEQALAGTMTALNAAKSEAEDLLSSNANLTTQMSDMTDQITRSEDLIVQQQQNIAALSTELEAEQTALSMREAELSLAQAEKSDAMTADFIALQASADATVAELTAAQQRIANLSDDANQHTMTVAALTTAAANADTEINSLRAEIAALTELAAATPAITQEDPSATALTCTDQTDALFGDTKITFDRGSATIAEDSLVALGGLIDVARTCADAGLILEIGGHTDSRGDDDSNQLISEDRALAVLNYLFADGVPSLAMNAVGFGESLPIADNATVEGRADNRRITFEWQQR